MFNEKHVLNFKTSQSRDEITYAGPRSLIKKKKNIVPRPWFELSWEETSSIRNFKKNLQTFTSKSAVIRHNLNIRLRMSKYFLSYLWWFKRIVCRKMDIKEKHSSFVNWFRGAKDCRVPLVKIVTFWPSAAKNKKQIYQLGCKRQ